MQAKRKMENGLPRVALNVSQLCKYWVLDQNLPEVLLKSVSELPLLVYGRSGLLQDNPKNPTKEGELWQNMAAPISSVYFDSANMDLYKERIKR